MNLGNENEIIEFKKSTSELKEAMNDISAILNKHGHGTLYFGVKPNGDVCGQNVSHSSLDDVATYIKTAIDPIIYPQIEKITIKDKDLIKVDFNGNEKPYSAYGRYYKRVHDRNEKITSIELKHMMLNNDYSSIWENTLTPFGIETVDLEALENFYTKATNCGRLQPLKNYSDEKLLSILGLFRDGKLNNAGYFLFSKENPTVLKMAVYVTDERINFSDINRLNGNIYNLIDKGIKYIIDHINWRVEFGDLSGVRREIPEVPVEAIREAVVNAFAHANYRSFTEHNITITPNIVEIYNPGEFPINYKPEDFTNESLGSIPRNRKILDILYKSKNVETQGSGIKRIIESCKKNNTEYSYSLDDYSFRLIFHRQNNNNNNNLGKAILEENTKYIALSETDFLILNILKQNPEITIIQLSQKIKKSDKTVKRSLNRLLQNNFIIRIGSNKKGYREVINKK